MSGRKVLLYFAWDRRGETLAPLTTIDDRFPAVFELRRLFYPKFEDLAGTEGVDQGIAGFLDHIQKPNFAAFAELAQSLTGHAAIEVERVGDDGVEIPLDAALIGDADTLVVISFDSLRTDQKASDLEVAAIRRFLEDPDHVLFLCPHHDIGEALEVVTERRGQWREAEHNHHGDRGIPPRQGFGGFARALLADLGAPVENRFGLRPAVLADGSPAPIEVDRALDVLGLLEGVETFNLHPHLPQLERLGEGVARMDVLARQGLDLTAPPHPALEKGHKSFDSLLQSRPEVFGGTLLVCDTTLFSSTAGGLDSLRRFWSNLLLRAKRT